MSTSDASPSVASRWLAAMLVLLAVVAYWPLKDAGWIWDDDAYVTENPVLVQPDGLASMWVPGGTPQFYPLVFMSFWIESHLYGEDFIAKPFGFHVVNLGLHLGSAFLLWRILKRLGVPGAWFAAALFLVHPMQVESVAWVTERKNVLALFGALASLRVWLAFEDARPGQRAGWYALALILFIAAMLAKTMVAVLAPALIGLHVWRRKPWTGRDLAAFVPFFAVGVPLGLITAWLERSWVGAEGDQFALSLADRLVLAPRSALWYVWTWCWPSNIAFVYERWEVSAADPRQWLAPMIAILAAVGLVVLWRRGWRGPGVLAAIFIGAVFPALGFLNVYPFLFSYVADHFAYVGTVALAAGGGYVLTRLATTWSAALQRGAAAAILLGLAVLSSHHVTAYEDEETMWRRTLATNPNAWMPSSNLAGILLLRASEAGKSGDDALAKRIAVEAEGFARRAIELNPHTFTTWMKLSESLRLQGRLDEALVAAEESVAREERIPDSHWMLGRLLEQLGRRKEAIEACRLGATLEEPIRYEMVDHVQAKVRRSDFAGILSLDGQFAEAGKAWLDAAAADPVDPLPYGNAGLNFERAGLWTKAADAFKVAIAKARPDRTQDEGMVMNLLPRLANALLTDPQSDEDLGDALDAARWLAERTGRKDPLALLLLARAEKAKGISGSGATFAEAQRLAADPAQPDALRAEIARFAPAFGESSGAP